MPLSGCRDEQTGPRRLSLGERIRIERQRLGMTQAELAGDEMTKSFISQVEANLTRPSLRNLQLLARRLNRPVSYFLDEPEVDSAEVAVPHLIRQARELAARTSPQEALALLGRALEEAPPHARSYRARILGLQAQLYAQAGRPAEAGERFSLAADEWRAAGDEREEAALLLAWARFERERGSGWEQITRLLERALYRLGDSPDDEWLHATLRAELGLAYARMGSQDQAIVHLREALLTMDDLTDFARYGEVALTLGNLLARSGQYDAARLMVERALHFFHALGDRRRVVEGYLHLVWILARSGDAPEAGQMLEAAARTASHEPQAGDLQTDILRARAWFQAMQGDLVQAEQLWLQALEGEVALLRQALIERELARLMVRAGRHDEARRHLAHALSRLEAAGDPTAPLGPFRQELARLCHAAGDVEQAASLFAGALEWFQRKGGAPGWSSTDHQDLWLLDLPTS